MEGGSLTWTRKHDGEQRLRTAVEHAAPDNLERILASTQQKGTVIPHDPTQKRRWIPAAMAQRRLVIVCGLSFSAVRWQSDHAVDSIYDPGCQPQSLSGCERQEGRSSQLPPSARTPPSSWEIWTSPVPDLTVAVNALIGSMVQNGYLDDCKTPFW